MKKIALLLSAITCAMTLVSFTLLPSTPDGEHDGVTKKEESAKMVSTDDVATESTASPCPCSRFTCSKGHQLEYSVKAYKEYSGRKCSVCNGAGHLSNGKKCSYCEGEGWEFSWRPGCVCRRCHEAYVQPDDCY